MCGCVLAHNGQCHWPPLSSECLSSKVYPSVLMGYDLPITFTVVEPNLLHWWAYIWVTSLLKNSFCQKGRRNQLINNRSYKTRRKIDGFDSTSDCIFNKSLATQYIGIHIIWFIQGGFLLWGTEICLQMEPITDLGAYIYLVEMLLHLLQAHKSQLLHA